MKKIVTIWWGNGQSNLLDGMQRYFPKKKYHISSIVSMSDDGRTTGELMRKFQEELGLHLPPPGDLRRCLFMMSNSSRKNEFQQFLETVIERDMIISELTIWDYFRLVGADDDFKMYLERCTRKMINSLPLSPYGARWIPLEAGERAPWGGKVGIEGVSREKCNFLSFTLPLTSSIKGHKVGNILMANLYYNFEKDYYKMLEVMHALLEVEADIIPVTTQKAYIRAILWNGEVIETQDRISNVASYTAGIADLELMEDSRYAYQHKSVFKALRKADYIIITPGDVFTSIISNFVIGWVKEVIHKSDAKIIYIWNSTNKWWETQWLTHLDIISKIERFLWKSIDIFICNNTKLDLSPEEKSRFQSHVSVKGWDYLYLSRGERKELEARKVKIFETALLDKKSLYKHDTKVLTELLEKIM